MTKYSRLWNKCWISNLCLWINPLVPDWIIHPNSHRPNSQSNSQPNPQNDSHKKQDHTDRSQSITFMSRKQKCYDNIFCDIYNLLKKNKHCSL